MRRLGVRTEEKGFQGRKSDSEKVKHNSGVTGVAAFSGSVEHSFCEIEWSTRGIGKRQSNAIGQRVHVLVDEGKVSVRKHSQGDKGSFLVEEFITTFQQECEIPVGSAF